MKALRGKSGVLASLLFLLLLPACGGNASTPPDAPIPAAASSASAPTALPAPAHEPWTLTILHTNDVHSRIDLVKDGDGPDVGGVIRRKAVVDRVRRERGADGVLLVDAGDFSTGTVWYPVWGGAESVFAMNALGYDAITLGNHEFDSGVDHLSHVLRGGTWSVLGTERTTQKLAAQVVVSNLDVSGSSSMRDVLVPRAIVRRGKERVGIVGALTDALPESVEREGVRVLPYVESVQKQVDALAKEGVDKIVLVSHCGTKVDIANAPSIAGVDVIVAGHDHGLFGDATLLEASGLAKSVAAQRKGDYPLHLTGKDGAPVLLVSAFAWGRILGRVDVTFDGAGHIEKAQGAPIVLSSAASDPTLTATLDAMHAPVRALGDKKIAVLPRALRRASQGQSELGVTFADALLGAGKKDGAVAALAEGDARADLAEGQLSYGKLYEAWPFASKIFIIELTGAELTRAVAHGLALEPPLQLAGMTAKIAPAQTPGQDAKVLDLRIGGRPVVATGRYSIAVDDWIAGGGDGFTWFKNAAKKKVSLMQVLDAMVAELSAHPAASRTPEKRVSVVAAP
ncbi:bifunctional metallophosphatase/5'-nucleotidase [Pendulispora brunnea]|uniref:Bifunctional metallophosphatase/5'-nucleotidase n=1 Tax=Pendulispora brunnea TaxID=2905690 RepID=A0ABZ2JYL1_9BACT